VLEVLCRRRGTVPEVLWSARDGVRGAVVIAGRCRRFGRERRTVSEVW
jgi:hypothetical protein